MVFEFPDPEPGQEGQDFIKRVIALPGDTLEAHYGHPVINGWVVPSCRAGMYPYREHDGHSSPYGELFVEFLGDAAYLTVYEQGAAPSREGPFHVGPGEVYVMGDNRNNSHDSRRWRGGQGAGVPYANIQGRAMMVWLPFSRFWVSVMGKPTLPKGVPAALEQGVAKCLAERPTDTTPPAPQANPAR
jgi:signal peptidase I